MALSLDVFIYPIIITRHSSLFLSCRQASKLNWKSTSFHSSDGYILLLSHPKERTMARARTLSYSTLQYSWSYHPSPIKIPLLCCRLLSEFSSSLSFFSHQPRVFDAAALAYSKHRLLCCETDRWCSCGAMWLTQPHWKWALVTSLESSKWPPANWLLDSTDRWTI